MKQGDLVRVPYGNDGTQHEIGTILKLGCARTCHDEEEEEDVIRHDGILVKTNISKFRSVYSPHEVELYQPEDKNNQGQTTRTTRLRMIRSAVTPSPAANGSSQELAAAAVAPMQQDEEDEEQVAGDEEGEHDSKSPAKRKRSSSRGKKGKNDGDEEEEDEEEEEEDDDSMEKPPAKRTRSSRDKMHKEVSEEKVEEEQEQGEDQKTPPRRAERSSRASRSQAVAVGDDDAQPTTPAEEEDISDKEVIKSPFFSAASEKTASTTASKKKTPTAGVSRKIKASQTPIVVIRKDSTSSEDDDDDDDDENGDNNKNHNVAGDDDDDDDDLLDRPFTVDYAPTGRATCRRCDNRIDKGALRVSHVPLFRGKPGFVVYRHLACATFSDAIRNVEDVGGWRKLSSRDRETLGKRLVESAVEMKQEEEELQPDELVQESFSGELRPSPPGLTANLLPFQTEGSSWMYCQEVGKPDIRCGILADEMGMGKTVQTISSLLDNRPILQHSLPRAKHPPSCPDIEDRKREEKLWETALSEWKHEMDMNNIPPNMRPKKLGGARAGTLVVCPVIALMQWKTEIEKFTEEGTLTVGIYHGPKRASEMPAAMMQKYDVVLTTFQVLEQDFRKMVSPNKVTCPNCGGKFKVDKLSVHLKYFCGENAERTEAQARQRRTGADRNDGGGGGGGKGGKKGAKSQVKPPLTKVAVKAKVENTKKPSKITKSVRKTIRAPRSANYDTDSEISVDENYVETRPRGRPSRSAAVKAQSRVHRSVKDWKLEAESDESSFASSGDVDTSDSEDSLSTDTPIAKKPRAAATTIEKKKGDSAGRNHAVERAREKQRQALEAASISKKKTPRGKVNVKGKGNAKGNGKWGKKKRFDGGSSSSSDDESDDKGDPMTGVDMNELMEEAMAGARFSPLHSFCWWRVVLDEAHFIKSRSSQTAAASFSLSAVYRWCLSGTPLQNRVGELYSLIRFLRIKPMAYYFCRNKECNCMSLHYRMIGGVCQDCGHRSFSHYAHFNRFILNPIQRDGYSGDGRRAMFKLKNEVLDKVLLRRTKETKAADLELPPRIVTLRSIRLHPIEADFYDALYTQTKSSFDDYIAEGTLLNNYAHIFDLLTKMRQAVNHPYLIVYSKTNAERNKGQKVANGSVDCAMCYEPPTERVLSTCCGAGFCRSCVVDYITGAGGGENTPCPSCQAPFTIDLNQDSAIPDVDDGNLTVSTRAAGTGSGSAIPSLKELSHVSTGSILRRINLAEFATSTKIEVLVQELVEMRRKRPGSKALVFSQFVNMLDLVRWRLHSDPFLADLNLGVKILHGGMDVKSRNETLTSFREDPGIRVLLMSLKSAGVALNLTAASEVYLLDLWWNPAAEMQALDRCHRIGQHRPIRAVRFVAEGTVEERVLQLQEKKRLVFDGTVGRDAGSLKMLSAEDMKALFT